MAESHHDLFAPSDLITDSVVESFNETWNVKLNEIVINKNEMECIA